MPKDTFAFTIFNEHSTFRKLGYKDTYNSPDSCWNLYSQDEGIIYYPILFIIKKSTDDTMQIHFNYYVHGYIYGTGTPIVNEILFNSGQFEVYGQTTKKDWINYSTSQKIKKQTAKQPQTVVQTPDSLRKLVKSKKLLFHKKKYLQIVECYYSDGQKKSRTWTYYTLVQNLDFKQRSTYRTKTKDYYENGKKKEYIDSKRQIDIIWDKDGKKTRLSKKEQKIKRLHKDSRNYIKP